MRKYFLIVFFALLIRNNYADSTYVAPSFYFTHGAYTNTEYSNSLAFYNTVNITKGFYLINHYEHLTINDPYWHYLQQAFLAGGSFEMFPYYLKLNYSHYKGDYNYITSSINNYSDYTNLYNCDFLYYTNLYYLGAAYTHENLIGYKNEITDQFTLRIDKIMNPFLYMSFRPNFTYTRQVNNVNNTNPDYSRKLFSASLNFYYRINPGFNLKLGGFFGQRAYYFDSDILTIFNQDNTQKYQAYGQIDYNLFGSLKLILSYQHTKFDDFSINYYTLGLKSNLFL